MQNHSVIDPVLLKTTYYRAIIIVIRVIMTIKILSSILINSHQLSPPTVQNMKAVGYVNNIWVTLGQITQRDKHPINDTKA